MAVSVTRVAKNTVMVANELGEYISCSRQFL